MITCSHYVKILIQAFSEPGTRKVRRKYWANTAKIYRYYDNLRPEFTSL